MSAVNELLDNAKNRLNLGSDIALAERVGVTRSLISRWRKGDTPLSDERIAQICALAKIEGPTWMAMIHAERATSATERALWRLILDRVSAAAAVVALVCVSFPGVANAKPIEINGLHASTAHILYIMYAASCVHRERALHPNAPNDPHARPHDMATSPPPQAFDAKGVSMARTLRLPGPPTS